MAARSRTAGRTLVLSLVLLAVAFGLVGLVGTTTPETGLDLTDGTRLTFVPEDTATAAQLDRAAEVVADRLDGAGVDGARVRAVGANEVVVEHPGDARGDVVPLVRREGRLRIRVVARSGPGTAAAPPEGGAEPDAEADPEAGEESAPVDHGDPVVWATSPDPASVEAYEAFSCAEAPAEQADSADQPHVACDANGTKYLLSPVVVEGERLSNASARVAQGTTDWGVRLRFDEEGSRAFGEMSQALVGTQRLFAVVLDGTVVSAPRMTNVVANGEANITGDFTEEGARSLATSLDSGTLPIALADEPVVVPAPATLDQGKFLTWVAVGFGLLLLIAFAAVSVHRRLGLVVPAAIVMTAAFSYALLVLLGQGLGLLLSPASLAGLIPGLLLAGHAATGLLAAVGVALGQGQSVGAATEVAVRRSRPTVALGAALPLALALILYVVARGALADFAIALAVAVVIATTVHLAFTAPLAEWLAPGARAGRSSTVPTLSVSSARPRYYAAAAALLVLGAVILVVSRPGLAAELGDAAGQTSARWSAAWLVVLVGLAVALFTYRFGSWRFAVAALAAVALDLVVVLALLGLTGAQLGHGTTAAVLAVLALSLRDKVLAFDAVEHPLEALSGKRRSLAESADRAVSGLLVQSRWYAVLVAPPLLALVVTGAVLGGLAPVTEVATVLLVGVLVSLATSMLLAVPLLVDLRVRVRNVRPSTPRPEANRPAAATKRRTPSKAAARPAPASRGPVRQSGSAKRLQPSRQTRAKRGKK